MCIKTKESTQRPSASTGDHSRFVAKSETVKVKGGCSITLPSQSIPTVRKTTRVNGQNRHRKLPRVKAITNWSRPVLVYGRNCAHNQGGDTCHGTSSKEPCRQCRRKHCKSSPNAP